MTKVVLLSLLLLELGVCLRAEDDPVVFKSDVAMTRVDAKVVDGEGRAITGLGIKDFVLTLNGKNLPVKNLANEGVPIDILLLLDVSGSMEPHVQRIASAARQALNVLADKDRVAIMIFDTRTTLRLPFRSSHEDVTAELNRILRQEHFSGGTRITGAMLDAARYVERSARPDARRAVVILTDDETQDEEEEPRVEAALNRANAVLSFLQAPYEPPQGGMGRYPGGGGGRRRGGWGGGGGGIGFPGGGGGWPGGGGVGFPGGGGQGRGGMGGGDQSHTAGTDTIAADSGGDTIPVNQASALQDTLEKLRQRYALYCYLPGGQDLQERQAIRVELSPEAQLLHRDAVVQSRRVSMGKGNGGETSGPTTITRAHDTAPEPSATETAAPTPRGKSRPVNEDSGAKINTVSPPE